LAGQGVQQQLHPEFKEAKMKRTKKRRRPKGRTQRAPKLNAMSSTSPKTYIVDFAETRCYSKRVRAASREAALKKVSALWRRSRPKRSRHFKLYNVFASNWDAEELRPRRVG
jgi:hypothetical protein